MRKWLCGFAFFLLSLSGFAQSRITGRVVNQATNEPLPFVNVSEIGSNTGTTSDVEGKFTLAWKGDSTKIIFTFVGFESATFSITKNDRQLLVRLTEKTMQLSEATVRPEDNPAFTIIRKVIAAKERNDPENLSSFAYNSYNKLYMSLDGSGDSAKNKKEVAIQKFAERNNIFVSESYTERKFLRPGRSKETILANKMSGIRDPFFAFMATDFQPFSFYKDYIPLLDVKYLNPISNGTFDKYDFTITDTIYHAPDSIFIISYEPLPGKAFQGLKGQLYISSDGFALEHVIAQTADAFALVDFHIQQEYAKIGDHWFPVQLNSELRFKEFQMAGKKPRYVQRSYLSNIRIGDEYSKKDFGLLNVQFDAKANFKDDKFWNEHRPDSLGLKERNTYKFYDSLGSKLNLLNTYMKFLEGVLVGKVRVGKFYIPIEYVARFNKYEKFRLGFGFETGERISQLFTLSGYAGWGFYDKALKYGGGLKMNVIRRHDGYVKFAFDQNIAEPGSSDFVKRPAGAINNETLRTWQAYRMDSVRQYKFEAGIRTLRYSQLEFFFQQQNRNPTYQYSFVTGDDALGQRRNFVATEAGIKLRMAWAEHYTQIGNNKVVSNAAYPQLNIYASHGFSGVWGGQYNFDKIEVQFDQQWLIRGLGTLSIQLDGGKINGKIPYPYLFNGKGANITGSFFNNFVINNYFQTMGFYEFASDRFAYFFLNHNFGRITGPGSNIFRPELAVTQSIGVGSLANLSEHQGIVIKTMDRGYYESGLLLNNAFRFKYMKLFYFGVGFGAFYRYGPYALPRQTDNFAFKFQLQVSF